MNIREMSLAELCQELVKPEWNTPLFFIGDIGGTSARLGFASCGSGNDLSIVTTRFCMKNKCTSDIICFLNIILETVPATVIKRVLVGTLSVPGPVIDGCVGGPFNNLKGLVRLSDYPLALFPANHSIILNDLEAGGFGVLAIGNMRCFSEHFALMWEGTMWRKSEQAPAGSVLGHGRCVVLAPGTGLGTCLIHRDTRVKQALVLPLELGSQTLPLRNDLAYVKKLEKTLKYVPSFENMVSGSGLEYHYKQTVENCNKPPLSAAQISKAAKEGDADAMKALTLFYSYLMRMGSEVSMGFVPLTVIIIGDNVVHNEFFFKDSKNLQKLRSEALNHPMERLGFQSRVTYLRQKKLLNMNLIGCYKCAFDTFMSGNCLSKM